MGGSKGMFSSIFKSQKKTVSNVEDEQPNTGWGAFAVCVFKRFIFVFVIGLIGANFIYLSGLSDANLQRLFPVNGEPDPTGPFCCGEPDMKQVPYTYLKDAPTGIISGFLHAIVLATRDTCSLMRFMIRQMLKVIGGFANGTGTVGRWSTYALWNMVFQMVALGVPWIATGIFWLNAVFYTCSSASASMPAMLDPNNWTIAQWAYFYGMKDHIENSKWLYFGIIAAFVAAAAVAILIGYFLFALPASWFVSCGVSGYLTIMFYLVFIFLPMCRDRDKLREILACDHKLLLAIFGLLCVMDARSTLDHTTAGAMQFVYFIFVIHAIYKYFS